MRRVFRRASKSNVFAQVVEGVIIEMLVEEYTYQDQKLHELVRENQALGGTMNGYRYDGDLYTVTSYKDLRGIAIKDIHPSLAEKARVLVLRKERLKKDETKLRNALSTVLSKCQTLQEMRDVLPDVIANKINQFQSMERVQEMGHVLDTMPHLKTQFENAMDIALRYHAARLLLS